MADDPELLQARIASQRQAGADHVVIQFVPPLPLPGAMALLERNAETLGICYRLNGEGSKCPTEMNLEPSASGSPQPCSFRFGAPFHGRRARNGSADTSDLVETVTPRIAIDIDVNI